MLVAVLGGVVAAAGWAAESFEGLPAGAFSKVATGVGEWTAGPGHAEVHAGHAKSGRQSLRLVGGGDQWVVLALREPLAAPARLACWAERWTAREPFVFRIDGAGEGGDFKELWNGDRAVRVGGFLTRIEVPLAAGLARLRLRCTAPAASGVMVDDVVLEAERPMRVAGVVAVQPVVPVLVGKERNPVLGVNVRTEGGLQPQVLEAVELEMEGTSRPQDIAGVELCAGGEDPSGGFGEAFGTCTPGGGRLVFRGRRVLEAGDNWLWVMVRPNPDADIGGRVDAAVLRVKVSGAVIEVPDGSPPGSQRLGVALRQAGDDGSKAYRIPGLARSKAGALIAVYDIRRRGAQDLPADIDVGVSRSADGGRTWEPMRVAIDMGRDPEHAHDGVGDPCVFVDGVTGRIWIAALWSHGNRAWHGSGPGLEPEETGQLVLVHSDDDGRTWSGPRNLTRQLKDPAWRLLLAGPGTGITMRDGTLVFPAQFRAADGKPWSTLVWSGDRGETWHIGTGVKSDTTEAQLVELGDGSIMINCRDDRGGARTVAVTRDLGRTWVAHPTDRKALPESVCMASLLRWEAPGGGPRLWFSNPATTSGRHTMTVKVSEDEGQSWPEHLHTIYDVRSGSGYSCLAPAGDGHLGVLYEGPGEIYFLRLAAAELLAGRAEDAFDPGTGARAGAPAALVPFPRQVEWGAGKVEVSGWKVVAAGDIGRAAAVVEGLPRAADGVPLRLAAGAVAGAPAGCAEAYALEVDGTGVRLRAPGDAGLLAGLATLRQLGAGGALPQVRVTDWPAFPVRGFMHDVGRNFQQIGTLERFIEVLAAAKLNVFHWHLSDGPGYRVESRRHPRLNAADAYLPTRSPGEFYTFEQVRGLIRHAHRLGVEVIPEIDMPGHSGYFERAFGFGMQDPRGAQACAELLEEVCDEVIEPLRREGVAVRWFHLGSDEVRVTNGEFLPAMVGVLRGRGLEVVVWRPGALPDERCITQLWAQGRPLAGVRCIDSAVNYVNHMDFFDGVPHAFFWQPCWRPEGDGQALGAILCHWPDVNAGGESNIYRQSPVMPALLAAAERFWRGLPRAHADLWARLPPPGDPRLGAFAAFERDLVAIGRRLAAEWPFPYVAQAALRWRVIGPFPHGGDVAKAFPPEAMERIGAVEVDGRRYEPVEAAGGTIHVRHFFGAGGVVPGDPQEGTVYGETWLQSGEAREVPCWIGFNTPSTSDRRAGPAVAGQWSGEGGRVWVNGEEVPPPRWANAGYVPEQPWADERPFVDEGYAYREPARIALRKGMNRVLVKAPRKKGGWKWMFSFAPLDAAVIPPVSP